MSKNNSKNYWEKFTSTGKVEDYLNYKNSKKKEDNHETIIKEKGDRTNI